MTSPPQNDPSRGDLGARMAEGTAWVVLMRLSIRALGVLSTIILARLLVPSDYGLIAIATVIVAAAELVCDFSFEIWLIRHGRPKRTHYNTVWTLSIIRGLLTAALLWLAAESVAAFYDEPRLVDVLRVIAIAIVVSSAQNIGIVDFQRDLRFDRDFRFNASVKLGAFVVTVTLGVLWRNYWALAAGIVTSNVLQFLLSYAMHAYRPRLSLRHWREAVGFSKWLLAGNILSFAHMRADTFILGKVAGGQVLGLYTVAREIANLATSELVTPIRRVMLPGYSKLQDDLPALRDSFISGFGLIVLIGVPCAVGLSVSADPLIRVFLGPKWLDAIPLMQALVLYGVAMIGMANQWPALVAVGRMRIASVLVAFGLLLLFPSFLVASQRYGAVGGALALGASNLVLFMAGLVAVQRALRYRTLDLWRNVWRTIVATLAMAATVLYIQQPLAAVAAPVGAVLLACVVAGAVVYVLVLYLLWQFARPVAGPEEIVVSFVKEKLAARR